MSYIFPDSDDGYGDSSDILYDAEEDEGEEGFTSLSAEAKEVLGGNVKVVDMISSSLQEDEGHGHASQTCSKTLNIPKLQLEDQHDDASSFVDGSLPEPVESSYVLDEKPLLPLDERSASYSGSSVRDVESPEIEENLPDSKLDEAQEVQEVTDLVKKDTVSLLEISEKTYIERGPRSLGDMTTEDEVPAISSVSLLSDDACNDASDTISFHIPAKSESEFASFDYSDDFEDFQEESGSTEKDNKNSEREEGPIAPSSSTDSPKKLQTPAPDPVPIKKAVVPAEGITPQRDSQKQSHKSKKDHVSRKVQSPPVERRRKNSSESAKTSASETARSPKPKRVGGGTPMIKPALLSSDKLSMKHNDSNRHKSRSTTHSPSASSSPLSSASSSSSYSSSSSSSASSYSVSRARSRNHTSISGPVRPTTHRSSSNTTKESNRVGGSSPVRPPSSASHSGASHAPAGPALGGRLAPPARVRKAASASDLHK